MPLPEIGEDALESLQQVFNETIKAVHGGKIDPAPSKSEYRNDVYARLKKLGAFDRHTGPEIFFGAMNAMLRNEEIAPRIASILYGEDGRESPYESDINYYLTASYGGHDNVPVKVKRFSGGGKTPRPGA